MADLLVLEWLEEFESLTESEIHTYSTEQEHNQEIMIAIYEILIEPHKYKLRLIDGICKQLLDFYRSGEKQLKNFTMQYIPVLTFMHLCNKSYTSVQTILVSLYNLEVIDSRGQPRCLSFRIPSIAQSSIYHDSTNLDPAFMAENSLRRYEECNSKLVSWGPLPQVECLNAQNRQRVITALLFLYNQQLTNVISQGIEVTCRGISSLVTQGFQMSESARSSVISDHNNSNPNLHIKTRIPISSNFLMEVSHIIYHACVRGVNGAEQALEDVIQRARYETYEDVMLVARAIRNLIERSPTMSITPRSTHQTVSKSMITNASFRTKKLPVNPGYNVGLRTTSMPRVKTYLPVVYQRSASRMNDIPILDEPPAEGGLDSISEEQEEKDTTRSKASVSALKHLPKLPGLSKKHKVKNPSSDQQVEMTTVVSDQMMESPPSDTTNNVHISVV